MDIEYFSITYQIGQQLFDEEIQFGDEDLAFFLVAGLMAQSAEKDFQLGQLGGVISNINDLKKRFDYRTSYSK